MSEEKEKIHLELGRPICVGLFAENGGEYSITGRGIRIDYWVHQKFGQKPDFREDLKGFRKSYILEREPETNYGIFVINRFDHSPGSDLKTIGVRFTNHSAHRLARRLMCKQAIELAGRNGFDLENNIDRDIEGLR